MAPSYHPLTHLTGAFAVVVFVFLCVLTWHAARSLRSHLRGEASARRSRRRRPHAADAAASAASSAVVVPAVRFAGQSLATLLHHGVIAVTCTGAVAEAWSVAATWLQLADSDGADDDGIVNWTPTANHPPLSSEGRLCVAFSKIGPSGWVVLKGFAYLVYFTQQRTVRPTEPLTRLHKLLLAASLGVFGFALVALALLQGKKSAIDNTCIYHIPVWGLILMLVADTTLSYCYLILFLQPLRAIIRTNKELESRMRLHNLSSGELSAGVAGPAAATTAAAAAAAPVTARSPAFTPRLNSLMTTQPQPATTLRPFASTAFLPTGGDAQPHSFRKQQPSSSEFHTAGAGSDRSGGPRTARSGVGGGETLLQVRLTSTSMCATSSPSFVEGASSPVSTGLKAKIFGLGGAHHSSSVCSSSAPPSSFLLATSSQISPHISPLLTPSTSPSPVPLLPVRAHTAASAAAATSSAAATAAAALLPSSRPVLTSPVSLSVPSSALAANCGRALEAVMRKNTLHCACSVGCTSVGLLFIALAHILKHEGLMKAVPLVGDIDILVTCTSIFLLMHSSSSSSASSSSSSSDVAPTNDLDRGNGRGDGNEHDQDAKSSFDRASMASSAGLGRAATPPLVPGSSRRNSLPGTVAGSVVSGPGAHAAASATGATGAKIMLTPLPRRASFNGRGGVTSKSSSSVSGVVHGTRSAQREGSRRYRHNHHHNTNNVSRRAATPSPAGSRVRQRSLSPSADTAPIFMPSWATARAIADAVIVHHHPHPSRSPAQPLRFPAGGNDTYRANSASASISMPHPLMVVNPYRAAGGGGSAGRTRSPSPDHLLSAGGSAGNSGCNTPSSRLSADNNAAGGAGAGDIIRVTTDALTGLVIAIPTTAVSPTTPTTPTFTALWPSSPSSAVASPTAAAAAAAVAAASASAAGQVAINIAPQARHFAPQPLSIADNPYASAGVVREEDEEEEDGEEEQEEEEEKHDEADRKAYIAVGATTPTAAAAAAAGAAFALPLPSADSPSPTPDDSAPAAPSDFLVITITRPDSAFDARRHLSKQILELQQQLAQSSTRNH